MEEPKCGQFGLGKEAGQQRQLSSGVEGGNVWRRAFHPVHTHVEPSPGCACQQAPKPPNGFHVLNFFSLTEGRAVFVDPMRWSGSKYLLALYVVIMATVMNMVVKVVV